MVSFGQLYAKIRAKLRANKKHLADFGITLPIWDIKKKNKIFKYLKINSLRTGMPIVFF
jgi:hypothetical protein